MAGVTLERLAKAGSQLCLCPSQGLWSKRESGQVDASFKKSTSLCLGPGWELESCEGTRWPTERLRGCPLPGLGLARAKRSNSVDPLPQAGWRASEPAPRRPAIKEKSGSRKNRAAKWLIGFASTSLMNIHEVCSLREPELCVQPVRLCVRVRECVCAVQVTHASSAACRTPARAWPGLAHDGLGDAMATPGWLSGGSPLLPFSRQAPVDKPQADGANVCAGCVHTGVQVSVSECARSREWKQRSPPPRAGSPRELEGPTGHRGCGWESGSNFQKDLGARPPFSSWEEVGEKLQPIFWRFVKFPLFGDIRELNSLMSAAHLDRETRGLGPKVNY